MVTQPERNLIMSTTTDSEPQALFAFFRDKTCAQNLSEGRDYYAAGIVSKRYDQGSVSGKEAAIAISALARDARKQRPSNA